MITFVSLHASGFGPLGQIELSLEQLGLAMIGGVNRDTDAADNNGAGKSHLLKALTWALFGNTIEGDKADAVIHRNEERTEVSVNWRDDDQLYGVTRVKERRKVETLGLVRLEPGVGNISGSTLADTQSKIEELLGMDFHAWRNTVLFGQGDLARFADPKTTDTQRKEILKRILRLDVLDRAKKLANKRSGELEKAAEPLRRELAGLEGELTVIDPTLLQTQIDELSADAKKALALVKKIPRLTTLAADLGSILEETMEAAKRRAELEREQASYTFKASAARTDAAGCAREIRRAEEALAKLKAGVCPSCGQEVDRAHIASKKKELTKEATDARSRSKQASAIAEELEAKAQALTISIKEAIAQDEDGKQWRTERDQIQADLREAQKAEKDLEVVKARLARARAQMAELETKLAQKEARAAEVRAELERTEAALAELTFWSKGFGNTGLPSFMLESVLPQIAERANHYLEILSDGDIQVSFDAQTKLAKGDLQEKLAIHWTIEGLEDVTPSGGQKKKIAIAVDLGLMDVVASRERAAIDLLLLDEVLDGLDATGKARVMTLLSELRGRRSTILVVSQDPGLAELFERTITVVKEGTYSHLEQSS